MRFRVRALRRPHCAEHFVCVDRVEILLHPPNLAIANDEVEMLSGATDVVVIWV